MDRNDSTGKPSPPDPRRPDQKPHPAPAAKPALVRSNGSDTSGRGGRAGADGVDAAFAVNRLTALAHELSNLLDGSMRCLRQARETVDGAPSTAATGQGRVGARVGSLSAPDAGVSKRLDTVYRAMEQMAGLVRSTMSGLAGGAYIGRRRGLVEEWTLAEAVEHAAEVMRPVAEEHGITIDISLDGRLVKYSAGAIYAALTAGIRNSIEAVALAGQRPGSIRVCAKLEEPRPDAAVGTGASWVRIEITDDGIGPPNLPAGDEQRVMEFGYSTKPAGMGIGLAMAADVVAELGGNIELRRRTDGPGAALRIRYPARPQRGV